MSKRRGFTLIELLVVIAIIALLMGILMPALRKVKEQANMAKCMANLRQWNLILSMYVQDSNGKFYSGLAEGRATDGFWWNMQLQEKQQSRIDNPLWFCPKNKGTLRDEFGHDNRKISFNSAWGIFTKADYARICDDGIAGSYGINGWVLDVPATGDGLSEGRTRVDHWRTPYVRGAGEVPLMVEALRFDVWPQPTQRPFQDETTIWSTEGTNHMARACMNRHLGHVNVSMCDFSVRRVGVKELYTLKWHRSFNTSGIWTIAGGVNDDQWPEWIRPFKDF